MPPLAKSQVSAIGTALVVPLRTMLYQCRCTNVTLLLRSLRTCGYDLVVYIYIASAHPVPPAISG